MLDLELMNQVTEELAAKDLKQLRKTLLQWPPQEVANLIEELPASDDIIVFRLLPRSMASETFEFLAEVKQRELVEAMAHEQERLVLLLNDLSPDDRTALLEEMPGPVAQRYLNLLTPEERKIAVTLLGYPEDSIGRLMTPDYVAVRPDWTIQRVLENIRRHGKDRETLNVIYVVDEKWRLIDDLRIREILLAAPDVLISDLMDRHFVALTATDDQETAIQIFRDQGRVALPVTDTSGVLIGIVTVDDMLEVAEEEATEDLQKVGGSEALETPYLQTRFGVLVRKRARWLVVLFLGEMLTASAMGYFEDSIANAVVLALFIPLIIASGGNSGSQAATLIIRALAVGEVTLRDWWQVMRREILAGLTMGVLLGAIGFLRVVLWQVFFDAYGEHWFAIGLTVSVALVGVLMLGTVAGSMLPLVMQRLGADPATSSTPFVATLVDVTGLVIYFSVAALLLGGALL